MIIAALQANSVVCQENIDGVINLLFIQCKVKLDFQNRSCFLAGIATWEESVKAVFYH